MIKIWKSNNKFDLNEKYLLQDCTIDPGGHWITESGADWKLKSRKSIYLYTKISEINNYQGYILTFRKSELSNLKVPKW